jgi:hypothetical protein
MPNCAIWRRVIRTKGRRTPPTGVATLPAGERRHHEQRRQASGCFRGRRSRRRRRAGPRRGSRGEKSLLPRQRMSAPRDRSASIRPFMGRFRICGAPSSLKVTAARRRAERRQEPGGRARRGRQRGLGVGRGISPPRPSTRMTQAASSSSTLNPSRRSASAMISVSSLRERAGQGDRAVAERGEEHGAVGQALGAGDGHASAGGRTKGFTARMSGRGGHGAGRNLSR